MRIRAVGRADVDADRRPLLVDGSVVAAFFTHGLLKLNKSHFFVCNCQLFDFLSCHAFHKFLNFSTSNFLASP